jgi:ethylmalonyl-CoA/methylmalonyl-CoA decarboxylase
MHCSTAERSYPKYYRAKNSLSLLNDQTIYIYCIYTLSVCLLMLSARIIVLRRGLGVRPSSGIRFKHHSSSRNATSLVAKHAIFLNAVKHHGEGSVVLEVGTDRIAEIVISNAIRKNAMSGKMLFELASIVDRLLGHEMDKVNCVILRSRGDSKVFCSGLDFNLAIDIVNTPEMGVRMSKMMTDTLNSLRNSSLISVAVLEGPAIGGGAELTTTCDFRIISATSYVQFVHGMLGVSPGWGGLNRLVSLVGRTKALKLLGTSAKLDANEAVQWGFADYMFPDYPNSADSDVCVRNFLKPYSTHKFPEALKNLKHAVVESSAVSEGSNTKGKIQELFAFERRWGGSDNKEAISTKTKK